MEAAKKVPAKDAGETSAHGQIYVSWEFPEYPRYERGFVWYAAAMAIGIGLLIYAIVSGNFLFALIILMFGLVFYMAASAEPGNVRIAITEDGVEMGSAFIPYREIRDFWFVYEPPQVRNLYLDFKSSVRPRLTIDLMDVNPNDVRKALSRYLAEALDEDVEPLSEILGRMFKI